MNRRDFLTAASTCTALATLPRALAQWQPSQRYPDPAIKIIDPSFTRYRLALAKIEKIASGQRWAEGPVWFGDGRYLLWSDIPNNRIMRWDEESGAVSVFRQPANNSNGNARDRQGRLLTCEHLTRRVTRTEYDGAITVIADRFEGKPLNSPNDLVCKSDGSIWFTDPPFGVLGYYEGEIAKPELPTHVYRWDPQAKQLAVVAGDVNRPNGLAFSPDESMLYIIEAGVSPRVIRAYDVVEGGKRLAGMHVRHGRKQRHARRPARRCGRQRVVRLGHGRRRPRRRGDLQSGRKTHRPHRSAGTLREPLLRWPPSQPAPHVRQHVGVFAFCEHPGRGGRLNVAQASRPWRGALQRIYPRTAPSS